MIAISLIAATLLTFRLSTAIAQEEGPFSLFTTLRGRVGQANWIGRGVHCLLCVSFWLAVPAALLLPIASIGEFALYWGAISGGVLLITKYLNKP